MGFESVIDEILTISSKSITHAEQCEASETIRRVSDKLAIHAYMLTGLPGTTLDSLLNDAVNIRNLVKEDWVDIVGNKILVPYPGTPYYESARDYGIRIHTNAWSRYDRRSYPVYSLPNLSQDELYLGYLMQEAVLTRAYLEKLESAGIPVDKLENITFGLDYLFANYAQNDEPQFLKWS
jgi:radical SAM superfamily enzyme YgiQ (UPF0313 family)